MPTAVYDFLSRNGFQPHGVCLMWRADVFYAHIVADVIIAASYFSIPGAIMLLTARRPDTEFRGLMALFAVFVFACGVTHAFAVWTMWTPDSGAEAVAKLVTAVVSAATAFAVWRNLPAMVALPSMGAMEERNAALNAEVAERRRVEATLTALNEELEARVRARTRDLEAQSLALEAASTAVVALDDQRRIVNANVAAREILGLGALAGPTPWPDVIRFVTADTLQPLDASADPIARGLAGITVRGETYAMTKPTALGKRYVRFSSATVRDADSPIRLVIVMDDITRGFVSQRETDRRNRLDALGQLTGGVAHDFNNLLGSIQPSLQVALLNSDDAEQRRRIETALGATARAADLTHRLLAFARQQPGASETVNVDGAFQEVVAFARRSVERFIDIDIDADPALHVRCDPALLSSCLLNLILNARDAINEARAGSRIVLAARPVSQTAGGAPFIELSVQDDGPGMSYETVQRALDPFFTTKRQGVGSGLGLSMAYGFARQAGGDLRIYSEPGRGARIIVTLPQSDGEEAAPTAPGEIQRGDGEVVLVAEDDEELRRALSDTLTAIGYAPRAVASGEEAIALLASGAAVDVVLSDIVMTGAASGFDVVAAARASDREPACILMSGYVDYPERGDSGEAISILQKPCDVTVLAAELKRAIRQAEETAARRRSAQSHSSG